MVVTGLIPSAGRIDFIDNIEGGTSQDLSGFGFRLSISNATNGDDIWDGTAATLPIPPDVGEQMQVVSTSANDDGAPAGTGVQTIDLHYIDANGLEQEETIIMNGVGVVPTVALNIRFVQEIHALTVGTNGVAAGTITISQFGAPATVYSQIPPGFNRSTNTARMVPSGKVLIIRSWSCSGGASAGGKTADIRLRTTSHHGSLIARVFQGQDNFTVFNTGIFKTFEPPIVVPAFGIVKCTSYATVAGADVQASWFGILVSTPI
jgi:hypothetical protein